MKSVVCPRSGLQRRASANSNKRRQAEQQITQPVGVVYQEPTVLYLLFEQRCETFHATVVVRECRLILLLLFIREHHGIVSLHESRLIVFAHPAISNGLWKFPCRLTRRHPRKKLRRGPCFPMNEVGLKFMKRFISRSRKVFDISIPQQLGLLAIPGMTLLGKFN